MFPRVSSPPALLNCTIYFIFIFYTKQKRIFFPPHTLHKESDSIQQGSESINSICLLTILKAQ